MSERNPDAAIPPGRAESSIAFTRAMGAVETRCAQIRTAIALGKLDGIEHLFQHAGNVWLAGRTACRHLHERGNAQSPYCVSARELLRSNGTEILKLIDLATTESTELQGILRDLRETLTRVMKEQFLSSPEPR